VGDVRADEVDPGNIEADHPCGLFGDLHVVRVCVERAVHRDTAGGHVAGQGELDHGAGGRDAAELKPLRGQQIHRHRVDLDPGQDLLVAHPPTGIGVGGLDELGNGVHVVPDHVSGHPFGDGRHPAADDEAPVVAPDQERLDEADPCPGLTLGDRPGVAHGAGVRQVQTDAPAMVAVQRLEHARIADPARGAHGCVGAAHRLAARDRQAGRGQQLGGQVLVTGDVDGQRTSPRRHGRADPLGVHALTQLDQRVLVEADPGDVTRDCLLQDR
jgi:hypothetical protein